MIKTFNADGIVLFCKKCKAYRTFYSRHCNRCNQVPVDKYIGQMELAGWKLIQDGNGMRRLI